MIELPGAPMRRGPRRRKYKFRSLRWERRDEGRTLRWVRPFCVGPAFVQACVRDLPQRCPRGHLQRARSARCFPRRSPRLRRLNERAWTHHGVDSDDGAVGHGDCASTGEGGWSPLRRRRGRSRQPRRAALDSTSSRRAERATAALLPGAALLRDQRASRMGGRAWKHRPDRRRRRGAAKRPRPGPARGGLHGRDGGDRAEMSSREQPPARPTSS